MAAFNGLQDDIQGAVNELSAALSASPVGGALANGVAALESEIGNIQNSLGAALQAPTIAAQQVSNALSSALSVPAVPPSISPPVTPPNQSGINT